MPFHESTMLKMRAKRRRDQELPDTDDEEIVDQPVEMAQEPAAPAAARAGAANATQGYRGAYHGDLPNQPRFAKRYQEQMLLHSRQTRFLCFTWSNSVSSADDQNSDFAINEGASRGLKPYGLGAANDKFYSGASQIINPAMAMAVNPINFSVRDLVDTKLLNRWGSGERAVYSKFRLLGFRVTIEFTTYQGSQWSIQPPNITIGSADKTWGGGNNVIRVGGGDYGYTSDNVRLETQQGAFAGYAPLVDSNVMSPTMLRMPMKYFVYRDAYLDYSGDNGFINKTGTDKSIGNTSNGMLAQDLANLNNFLEIVNDGESFHFERKINAKAAYFIPPTFFVDQNLNQPLHILVAALESLDQQASIVTPLPEGFHMIFAPINPPFQWTGRVLNQNGQPNREYTQLVAKCYTQAYIKVEADWEAWDFNYALQDPARHHSQTIEICENFKKIADNLIRVRHFTTSSKKPFCMSNNEISDPITELSDKCDDEIRERSSVLEMTN